MVVEKPADDIVAVEEETKEETPVVKELVVTPTEPLPEVPVVEEEMPKLEQ